MNIVLDGLAKSNDANFRGKDRNAIIADEINRLKQKGRSHTEADAISEIVAKAAGESETELISRGKIRMLTNKYVELSKASGLPTQMERVKSAVKVKSKEIIKKPLTFTAKQDKLASNIQLFAERDLKKQESASLRRAINKYQRRIAEHKSKIENPAYYVPNWKDKDVREQQGLIKHWQREIRNFQTSISDRIDELKLRGDYDE